ncbi:MAG: hypothetical protein M3508_01460 [Actinomycetota bacterium]|nr:hypothetical protein [Actinomycetota bacterium]
MSMRKSPRRARRHGENLEPNDRRMLERDGWRTMLDYSETHIRSRDGCLLRVVPAWTAEAELFDDGDLVVATGIGTTADEAWAQLRLEVEAGPARAASRVRLLRP